MEERYKKAKITISVRSGGGAGRPVIGAKVSVYDDLPSQTLTEQQSEAKKKIKESALAPDVNPELVKTGVSNPNGDFITYLKPGPYKAVTEAYGYEISTPFRVEDDCHSE